ncbi:MAG: ATP-binding cassette domain-containing protein [Gemmatimonadota bacterium]|jgi:ABC-type transport system involved in cytochrome c biogenesis ATPase subunit
MLEAIELTVTRGPTPVVRDLDLVVDAGGIFWIVGPNGAGKSSLLRVLAGLDRPRGGRVVRRLPIGTPLLYFHSEMRVPPGATAGDWRRLADRLLPATASGPTALWPGVRPRRPVHRLSTGEQKRLLLDVVLRRAGAVILDEPFEHLSPDAKRTLARRLQERARKHVVIVATNQSTHRAGHEGGLHLEAGAATPLGSPGGREFSP